MLKTCATGHANSGPNRHVPSSAGTRRLQEPSGQDQLCNTRCRVPKDPACAFALVNLALVVVWLVIAFGLFRENRRLTADAEAAAA